MLLKLRTIAYRLFRITIKYFEKSSCNIDFTLPKIKLSKILR